ncbi:MAG: hypothetical protein V4801_37830, partial [Burkholderia gladioli]
MAGTPGQWMEIGSTALHSLSAPVVGVRQYRFAISISARVRTVGEGPLGMPARRPRHDESAGAPFGQAAIRIGRRWRRWAFRGTARRALHHRVRAQRCGGPEPVQTIRPDLEAVR